jgi:2-octaprenyl-6-methoxyphenol hydroxylase
LRFLRQVGLRLVDQLNPIKRALQKEAAGLTGDLPRLMRGLAA